MSIGDYCQRHPQTATASESIRVAASRMEAAGAGCLMVVDEQERPIGVVTDRDVVLPACGGTESLPGNASRT